jgi:hypothetical protein
MASRYQQFASLNQGALDNALRDPTNLNWGQFFGSVKPADIADSDAKAVGRLLKVLSYSA